MKKTDTSIDYKKLYELGKLENLLWGDLSLRGKVLFNIWKTNKEIKIIFNDEDARKD